MTLRVYNTLTRQKEPFETVQPRQGVDVRMRADGLQAQPSRPHGRPGHLRRHQTLPRPTSGYEVTFVVNITDVDDKLIIEAHKQNTTVAELAERITADYCRTSNG